MANSCWSSRARGCLGRREFYFQVTWHQLVSVTHCSVVVLCGHARVAVSTKTSSLPRALFQVFERE